MKNKSFVWGIVAVLVLIVVVIILFPGGEDVGEPDPVNVQCAFFCDTNQKTGFCSFEIQVEKDLQTTCNELAINPSYDKYNVATCPSISCETTAQEQDQTCVSGLNSVWVNPTPEGDCPAQGGKFSRKRTPSDEPPTPGQICCFYYE